MSSKTLVVNKVPQKVQEEVDYVVISVRPTIIHS